MKKFGIVFFILVLIGIVFYYGLSYYLSKGSAKLESTEVTKAKIENKYKTNFVEGEKKGVGKKAEDCLYPAIQSIENCNANEACSKMAYNEFVGCFISADRENLCSNYRNILTSASVCAQDKLGTCKSFEYLLPSICEDVKAGVLKARVNPEVGVSASTNSTNTTGFKPILTPTTPSKK